jgi:hypothetical protein
MLGEMIYLKLQICSSLFHARQSVYPDQYIHGDKDTDGRHNSVKDRKRWASKYA